MKRDDRRWIVEETARVMSVLRTKHNLQGEVAENLVRRYWLLVSADLSFQPDEKVSVILKREQELDPTEEPVLPQKTTGKDEV